MYVKITKGLGWHEGMEGEIFNVYHDKGANIYILKVLNDHYIDPNYCEEINLDQFDGQISEEFADKLLNEYYCNKNDNKKDYDYYKGIIKIRWKAEKYIKQSREDELREEIKKIGNSSPRDNLEDNLGALLEMITNQEELIKILDKKLKELKG